MELFRKFFRYMNPSVDPDTVMDMDRQSIRNIYYVSLVLLCVESVTMALYLITHVGRFMQDFWISFLSVLFCIFCCVVCRVSSRKMLGNKFLKHDTFFAFKIITFVMLSVWAMFVDYRHYKQGEQMLTFYNVMLVMICFVHFRPWIGTILYGCAYGGLYILLYSVDGAASIQKFNYFVFMLASMASNAILYHYMIHASSRTVRLIEDKKELLQESRHDGLTGLLNRLALETDAEKMDGRRLTAYMLDINYFKEINDRYGHAAGDTILRDISRVLLNLFPGAHYYRYGGDEFLVLSYKPAFENYAADTYEFRQKKYHVEVLLSIGNAQGTPENYQELFDLIARADKALYSVKERTHSIAFGGHERRRSAQRN